jgi:hypothetical protein
VHIPCPAVGPGAGRRDGDGRVLAHARFALVLFAVGNPRPGTRHRHRNQSLRRHRPVGPHSPAAGRTPRDRAGHRPARPGRRPSLIVPGDRNRGRSVAAVTTVRVAVLHRGRPVRCRGRSPACHAASESHPARVAAGCSPSRTMRVTFLAGASPQTHVDTRVRPARDSARRPGCCCGLTRQWSRWARTATARQSPLARTTSADDPCFCPLWRIEFLGPAAYGTRR